MTVVQKENEMGTLSDKLLKIAQALLAWLVFIIFSPILLLLFGSLFIWKYGVLWVIVKLFKRKFIRSFEDTEAFFAVDRFWEDPRSSLGLIVELEGTINVDVFRDNFRKNILDYPVSSQPQVQNEDSSGIDDKPFAKLTQIPSTFCGYYYWQKANYFLMHEHIRQINQPTDELGLKKAVGTLMNLPFPNRRPLWEILVYSNYLGTTTMGRGTTCGSVLFIRVHRSVTDSQGLINIFRHMLMTENERTNLQVKSIQINPSVPTLELRKKNESKNDNAESRSFFIYSRDMIMEKFTDLVYLPFRSFQFAQRTLKTREGIVTCAEESAENTTSNDSAYASWVSLSEILIWKTCATQSPKLSRSAVELSLFLEGLTSRGRRHKCFNVPEEKGVPTHQGKCQTSVLIPLPKVPHCSSEDLHAAKLLPNDISFSCVKCPCVASSILQTGGNKASFLKTMHSVLEEPLPDHRKIVKIYLKMLTLLPRHLLRYLLMSCKWGAGYLMYENFQMYIPKGQTDDPRVFGQYIVSQVVPLVGLQWTHTIASAATLKWQERPNVVMSIISNPTILGPLSQGNPQDHLDRIVRGLPEELERLGDDEDHGFVSIPIS